MNATKLEALKKAGFRVGSVEEFLGPEKEGKMSEFLEDVECNGVVTLLSMSASGFAELTILEPDLVPQQEGSVVRFPLTPNKVGLANAEKIMAALKEWSEHIKRAGLVLD